MKWKFLDMSGEIFQNLLLVMVLKHFLLAHHPKEIDKGFASRMLMINACWSQVFTDLSFLERGKLKIYL